MKINFNDEVSVAAHFEKPIVALESTVIAHGLPYPKNIETAKRMEGLISEGGATPATTAKPISASERQPRRRALGGMALRRSGELGNFRPCWREGTVAADKAEATLGGHLTVSAGPPGA